MELDGGTHGAREVRRRPTRRGSTPARNLRHIPAASACVRGRSRWRADDKQQCVAAGERENRGQGARSRAYRRPSISPSSPSTLRYLPPTDAAESTLPPPSRATNKGQRKGTQGRPRIGRSGLLFDESRADRRRPEGASTSALSAHCQAKALLSELAWLALPRSLPLRRRRARR